MLQQALHFGRWLFGRLILASVCSLALLGCGSAVTERTVSDVRLHETTKSDVELDEVLSGLAITAPRTLFWIERERDVYDANLVGRDLERVERYYRAQGYFDIKVVAARVLAVGERKVAIEIEVTPGQRSVVRSVDRGTQNLDFAAQLIVPSAEPPVTGSPLTEQALSRYEGALTEKLKEGGYPFAKVRVSAKVDLNQHAADISVEVTPGPRARVGEIRIIGLKQIPESKVRALLGLTPGQIFTESDRQDAIAALGATQLFTRYDVSPEAPDAKSASGHAAVPPTTSEGGLGPTEQDVPIIVTVQEDQLRRLLIGGGTIADSLKFETHLRVGWEHRNFLGGARKLSVDVSGGFDLYPWRIDLSANRFKEPINPFFVIDSSVTLEQPALFNGRTKGIITANYSRKPVLYALPAEVKDTTAPAGVDRLRPYKGAEEVVLGYHTPSGHVALERSFLGGRIVLRPAYNLEARVPFAYQNTLPESLQTVWVSYPSFVSTFRTKPGDLLRLLDSSKTSQDKSDFVLWFRNSVEIAGLKVGCNRLLGGSVSDLKIAPEVRWTFPLIGTKRNPEQRTGDLLLAGRTKLGFLLLADYGATLREGTSASSTQPANSCGETATGDQQSAADQQKLLSRAFYSGGANSDRGYPERAVSPTGPIDFLLPPSIKTECLAYPDDPRCTRPLGGFTQWEASLELRYSGLYPLGLVAFVDAADVSRNVGNIQFRYPHVSVGPGLRYETPVGPIRLDIGIRVPGAQAWGQSSLPLNNGQYSHGQEPHTLLGLPAAIHLAIGDAFPTGDTF